jgi:hypothetical protein
MNSKEQKIYNSLLYFSLVKFKIRRKKYFIRQMAYFCVIVNIFIFVLFLLVSADGSKGLS